jgi:hypothetical protein
VRASNDQRSADHAGDGARADARKADDHRPLHRVEAGVRLASELTQLPLDLVEVLFNPDLEIVQALVGIR